MSLTPFSSRIADLNLDGAEIEEEVEDDEDDMDQEDDAEGDGDESDGSAEEQSVAPESVRSFGLPRRIEKQRSRRSPSRSPSPAPRVTRRPQGVAAAVLTAAQRMANGEMTVPMPGRNPGPTPAATISVKITNPLWFLNPSEFDKPPPRVSRRRQGDNREDDDEEADDEEDEAAHKFCPCCTCRDINGNIVYLEEEQKTLLETKLVDGYRTGRMDEAIEEAVDYYNNIIRPTLYQTDGLDLPEWTEFAAKNHLFNHSNEPFLKSFKRSKILEGMADMFIEHSLLTVDPIASEGAGYDVYKPDKAIAKLVKELLAEEEKITHTRYKLYAPKTIAKNSSARSFLGKTGKNMSPYPGKKSSGASYTNKKRV